MNIKEYINQEDFNKDKQKYFSLISKYFDGYKYGFLVKDAKSLKHSIRYWDKLGFFNIDDSLIKIELFFLCLRSLLNLDN
jgi:hypothetical protein